MIEQLPPFPDDSIILGADITRAEDGSVLAQLIRDAYLGDVAAARACANTASNWKPVRAKDAPNYKIAASAWRLFADYLERQPSSSATRDEAALIKERRDVFRDIANRYHSLFKNTLDKLPD